MSHRVTTVKVADRARKKKANELADEVGQG